MYHLFYWLQVTALAGKILDLISTRILPFMRIWDLVFTFNL